MSTDIEIANMALFNIKHSKLIQSFDESGIAASACKLFYSIARDELLSEYAWLFAQKQEYLALSGTPPLGWDYQYVVPTNCIKPLYIYNQLSNDPKDKIPFEKRLSSDGTSTVIVTNEPQASLVYTYKLTNASLYPPYFVVALSYLLAEKLCQPLSKSDRLTKSMMQIFDLKLNKAKPLDAISFHKKNEETASYHDARLI